MKFKQRLLSVLVLVCLLAVSSVVSIKLSFEIPGVSNTLMLENCAALNFCKPAISSVPQNKILIDACNRVITREQIMTYLEKQTKSPPLQKIS